eukprot:746504-Hanusia_phi.AAC.13
MTNVPTFCVSQPFNVGACKLLQAKQVPCQQRTQSGISHSWNYLACIAVEFREWKNSKRVVSCYHDRRPCGRVNEILQIIPVH